MTLYLYAFVDHKPRKALGRGIHARALSAVSVAKSAWAIVETGDALAAEPETIVAHDRVVQRIAQMTNAILPLRFASTAADRAALASMILPLSGMLGRAFDRVRDAVQFTLRVSGPAPKEKKKRSAAASSSPGTQWMEARMAAHRAPEIDAVTLATKRFIRESRIERKAGNPPLLAVAYHLVPRENVTKYERALAKAIATSLDPKVSVRSTGPWPPYAFAELG